ncbi:precorrin-2 dehydrogenase / sirohydrochlorin ferrochelatase [Halobacillus dabanensis]|uniref:precorrin-2 dehydrogenase n=1 Tax=Halobacillus dabanensis TaxID=240302 RepID=A0A1I3VHI4_HALDA|nr:NAD(P)-binding protein [Halobacillus dabanensis]SFJ94620.1 precorrin-2 dehydrogenase / sirohydrochlorin ferrochelatase [Halobacillus dabanensis]
MTPMMVDVRERKAMIIGGGRVAFKRAKLLKDHGAYVTIISPHIIEELDQLLRCFQITWKNKKFEPADLSGAFIVVVATNDHKENERIAAAASEVPLLNRADGGDGGNLHFPGIVSRGKLTMAISTGGASPMLASRIKKRLEKEFPSDYENYVAFLFECRQLLKQSGLSKEVQHDFLERMLEESYQDPTFQQKLLMEIHKAREEK